MLYHNSVIRILIVLDISILFKFNWNLFIYVDFIKRSSNIEYEMPLDEFF